MLTFRTLEIIVIHKKIYLGLITAILTATIEELLFRNILFEELNSTQKNCRAIIYSSLIFGSIHLLNINSLASIPFVLVQVLYTAFLGLILAVAYNNTNNLIIPILNDFDCPLRPCLWERRQTSCEGLGCLKFDLDKVAQLILS